MVRGQKRRLVYGPFPLRQLARVVPAQVILLLGYALFCAHPLLVARATRHQQVLSLIWKRLLVLELVASPLLVCVLLRVRLLVLVRVLNLLAGKQYSPEPRLVVEREQNLLAVKVLLDDSLLVLELGHQQQFRFVLLRSPLLAVVWGSRRQLVFWNCTVPLRELARAGRKHPPHLSAQERLTVPLLAMLMLRYGETQANLWSARLLCHSGGPKVTHSTLGIDCGTK